MRMKDTRQKPFKSPGILSRIYAKICYQIKIDTQCKVGDTYQKGTLLKIWDFSFLSFGQPLRTYNLQPPQLSTLITYDYNIYLIRCALIVYIVFLHHLSLFPPGSANAAA